MEQNISPSEWLSAVKSDYLDDFIKQGGAAVKFAVVRNESTLTEVREGLSGLARDAGFIYTAVSAEQTKIHFIEQIFFQVARQLDWDALALRFMRAMLNQQYNVPENDCDFTLDNLAMLNGYAPRDMRPAINTRLEKHLFKDYAMTQEFRIAMMHLCRRQLDCDEVHEHVYLAVKEWLRGELRLISTLKSAFIYQKISRVNGRNMLYSLARWLRLCGYNGLVLVLDISRYTQDRLREPDGSFYYSTSAVMDCFEVLRQFIDSTDEAGHCFITVIAPQRFVELDDKRGVGSYDALKLRIWDEVHDKRLVNPLAPLVRFTV